MRYLKIISLTIFITLTGCAATLHKGPKFTVAPPPANGLALVYLYRPHSPPLWRSPTIYINNLEIMDLYNQGYTYLYVKPGKYHIKTDWSFDAGAPDLEGDATFKSGKTYYIKLGGNMSFSGNTVKTSSSLGSISPVMARSEIAQCMFINPKIVKIP